ncbi:type III secretion system inner rod subunit SctI [Candidatus Fukatsuia endosymbiont of Tuberolachnus salignus]|uniref:type III secretion system inner rod subunit SctI n=1 Tax=Candidatus Fukatsuia endosymbiont of Tuberolachnus salignus TaxID=3077957 RepID=UPI00313B8C93
MHSLENIKGMAAVANDITPDNNPIVSLEDRMVQSYATNAVDFSDRRNEILAKIANPRISTDELAQLQKELGEYNFDVSLISALTKKVTGAVETCLRA